MRGLAALGMVFCGILGAEEQLFEASHEAVVAAAMDAIVLETRIARAHIVRQDGTLDDGRTETRLFAPYASYHRLAAKLDAKVRSGGKLGAQTELDVKVTTGNLVWSRHKHFEEQVLAQAAVRLARKPFNDTRPTALPPEAVPEPKDWPAKEAPKPPQPAPKQ